MRSPIDPFRDNGRIAALSAGSDLRSFTKVNSLGPTLAVLHSTRSDEKGGVVCVMVGIAALR